MDQAFIPILKGVAYLLTLYKAGLVFYALMSWLYLFGIIRPDNMFFGRILELLRVIIEPILSYLRRFIPSPGGLDLSFLVLFLAVHMADEMITVIINNMIHNAHFAA